MKIFEREGGEELSPHLGKKICDEISTPTVDESHDA